MINPLETLKEVIDLDSNTEDQSSTNNCWTIVLSKATAFETNPLVSLIECVNIYNVCLIICLTELILYLCVSTVNYFDMKAIPAKIIRDVFDF